MAVRMTGKTVIYNCRNKLEKWGGSNIFSEKWLWAPA